MDSVHKSWKMIAKIWGTYCKILRQTVLILALAAGVSICVMMTAICADVILRQFGKPIVGVYDVVKIAGALSLAFALPYTTAIKGHVAIEYFFHKLGRKARIVVDTFLRLLSMVLFGFLGWRSFIFGQQLQLKNEVSMSLGLPIFWVPWVIGICCFMVMLVTMYHLVQPSKEMIKP